MYCGVDAGDEFLVVRRVEAGGVPAGAVDADRLLAHHLEDALVGHGGVAEHGDLALQAEFGERLEEAQRVGAGKAGVDRVDVRLDLREIGAVFRRVERRPQLLHDLAAGRLEGEMEAAGAFVAVGEILGDDRRSS